MIRTIMAALHKCNIMIQLREMPKGIRKIYFTFGKTGLTRWGGLSLFVQFCKYLGLRRFLQIYVRWPDYNHRAYHPADLFLAHIYSLVIGIGRIENSQSLIHNGLIPPLLGLPEFPHRDTLRTFLWRFDKFHLNSLQTAHDNLRKYLYQSLGLQYSATIDIDTTALMTYGHQEGVAVGYIPKRRHGKPSYAPIISSEGHTGLSLGAELRSGDVHASTGAFARSHSPHVTPDAGLISDMATSTVASMVTVRGGSFTNRAA